MQTGDIRKIVLDTVETILPGTDTSRIHGEASLRAQVDLDSIDWLNVLTVLGERLGLKIPERDYGKLRTLDDMVEYLHTALAAQGKR